MHDVESDGDRAARDWIRRFGTLYGVFGGLGIAFLSAAFFLNHLSKDSPWLSPAGILLGFALLSLPSIPLGIYLSLKFHHWLLPGSGDGGPPREMPVSQFRTILHRIDAAAICCVGGSFAFRIFPIVPRMVYAIAMTLSICFSLGVFLIAAWATVLQPIRYHFVHIVLGLALVAATAYLWMTFFQPQ